MKRFLIALFVIAYVLGNDPIPGPIDDILMMIFYHKYSKNHKCSKKQWSPYKKEYYRQFNKRCTGKIY